MGFISLDTRNKITSYTTSGNIFSLKASFLIVILFISNLFGSTEEYFKSKLQCGGS